MIPTRASGSLHMPCDLLSAMELIAAQNQKLLEEVIADALYEYVVKESGQVPEAQTHLMNYITRLTAQTS